MVDSSGRRSQVQLWTWEQNEPAIEEGGMNHARFQGDFDVRCPNDVRQHP